MGRPLNKRNFTTAAAGATASKNEIKVSFHNGSAVKEGTIIKQKGSKRFVVAETGADDTEYTCTLKTGVLPAALSAGEMSIMVLGMTEKHTQFQKLQDVKLLLLHQVRQDLMH